jgi:hypothetical protein
MCVGRDFAAGLQGKFPQGNCPGPAVILNCLGKRDTGKYLSNFDVFFSKNWH